MIGFIDFLGVFQLKVDPEGRNGYIPEYIEDSVGFFHKLTVDNKIESWKASIQNAYNILSDIYNRLYLRRKIGWQKKRLYVEIIGWDDYEIKLFSRYMDNIYLTTLNNPL